MATPRNKSPSDLPDPKRSASSTIVVNPVPAPVTMLKVTGDGKMKVNFSAVADSFTPREAGDVEATLIGHTINAASATSGNPTVKLDWSENDSPNRHIFKTYSLQPKALWSLKRDLIRMGASVEAMNDEDADLDDILLTLYGNSCTIIFGDPRPYTDKEGQEKLGDNFKEVADPSK